MKLIKECPFQDWALQARQIKSSSIGKAIHSQQNIFSSLQFVDDEIALKKTKTFSLICDQQAVAWVCIYFLSPSVLRVRGLFVVDGHRGKGNMTELLIYIFNLYRGHARKILSFSTPAGIKFHEKFGFQTVREFIPRPVVIYDHDRGEYVCDENEPLTLFFYDL